MKHANFMFYCNEFPTYKWPIQKWHKDQLVLIGDASHPMLTFQGQGDGQAIKDGAALGILLDQIRDHEDVEERLQLFERVRRNRGSALQILSNTNPSASQSVRDAAAAYLPSSTRLDPINDFNNHVYSFDVIREFDEVLAAG